MKFSIFNSSALSSLPKGFQFSNKGMSFIDVLVGTALALVVFLGIFGAFQLGLKVVGQSKARITAIAIANQRIEIARNLSYDKVGTYTCKPEYPDCDPNNPDEITVGIVAGTILEQETITRNNIDYTVKTTVVYIDDPFDNVAPQDTLPTDYKRIKVKVSWSSRFSGKVELTTDIAPKGIETSVGGGTLFISVFDAQGQGLSQADLHIVNTQVNPQIDAWYQADNSGNLVLPGAPISVEAYQITASKVDYSTDKTYNVEEVANPSKPEASIYEGQLTQVGFSIDKLAVFSIDTISPVGVASFFDSFLDETKISEKSDVIVSDGKVTLATIEEGYFGSGYLTSLTILPQSLTEWDKFYFTDEEPADTQINYQILYFEDPNWVLIPDSDLTGNAAGFNLSPVDLSELPIAAYSQIRLKGNFLTSDPTSTPVLYDWQVAWKTSTPVPVPYTSFKLEGAKTIGTDSQGQSVLKYSQDKTTNGSGHLDIVNLEWDSYSFSVDKDQTGLNLIEIQPPQPVDLLPNSTEDVVLILKAENTLLATINDSSTLLPIFAASVRVFNISYDQIQPTDSLGQAFFIPLENVIYNLEIGAPGYQTYTGTGTVAISGDTAITVNLTQLP